MKHCHEEVANMENTDNSEIYSVQCLEKGLLLSSDVQHNNSKMKHDLFKSFCQASDNYLYSISGFFDQPINSIERYDTLRGTWTEIKNALNVPRTKFSAVTVSQRKH